MPIRTLLILLLAAIAVAGCGRRGGLQEPAPAVAPTAEAPAATAETAEERPIIAAPDDSITPGSGAAANTLDTTSPGAQEPSIVTEPGPDRPFFLDFLL